MLNNCVGRQNRPAVIAYLVTNSGLLVMMALSTMFNIIRVVPARDSSQNQGVSLKVIVLGIGLATFVVVFTMISYLFIYT